MCFKWASSSDLYYKTNDILNFILLLSWRKVIVLNALVVIFMHLPHTGLRILCLPLIIGIRFVWLNWKRRKNLLKPLNCVTPRKGSSTVTRHEEKKPQQCSTFTLHRIKYGCASRHTISSQWQGSGRHIFVV